MEHRVLHPFLLVISNGQSLEEFLSSLEISLNGKCTDNRTCNAEFTTTQNITAKSNRQKWLFGSDLYRYTFLNKNTPRGIVEYSPSQIMRNAQAYIFYDLMENDRLMRMLENEMHNGKKAYTAVDLMNDLHRAVFATTIAGRVPDVITRNTQKLFVDALITAAASVEGIKINKRIANESDRLGTTEQLWGERILNPDEHLFW